MSPVTAIVCRVLESSYSFGAHLDLFSTFYHTLVPAWQRHGVFRFDRILVPDRLGGYNTCHDTRNHHGPGKTERDFIGYGGQPPHAAWPGDAGCCSIYLNYEEAVSAL